MTKLQQLQEEGDKEFDELMVCASPKKVKGSGGFFLRTTSGVEIYDFNQIRNYINQREDKAFKAGKQDMLERVKSVIPKGKELIVAKKPQDPMTNSNHIGFNACRQETLKALDKLKN